MALALDGGALRGALLSGACSSIAHWAALRVDAQPSVPELVQVILGLTVKDEFGPLHPALALVQTLVDPADPIHFYPHLVGAPLDGQPPKSLLLTEGVRADGTGDTYVPPAIIEGNAAAAGLPLVAPSVRDVPLLTRVAGIPTVTLPLVGNLALSRATGALVQFAPGAGEEGHYVAQSPPGRDVAVGFVGSLLSPQAGAPTVPAP
jgi:hypothetical protein